MNRIMLIAITGLLTGATAPPHWSESQLAQLAGWSTIARDDGLTGVAGELSQFDRARAGLDPAATNALATRLADKLLTQESVGCCNVGLRASWHIANGLEHINLAEALTATLREDRLDLLLAGVRQTHPFYLALRAAFAQETDPERRHILAVNLDRWRWMPRDPGRRYLLVNAATFEATLWQDQRLIGRWAVIVGKARSPTPVFAAKVTGVTLNPWWDIPPDIARESIAALYARDRAEAGRRGYVRTSGRFRQKPGPTNALGAMKLVMPNPYSVYLHDTPARDLFKRDIRVFSHGCVRVGDALGLAATLLAPDWDRARIDGAVAASTTQTIALAAPIPVYVAYFTAEPDGTGGLRLAADPYHRDIGARASQVNGVCQ